MSKNFAVISGDTITNVIVANNLADAKKATNSECIETDGSPWIGWTRSGKDWVAPSVVEDIVE